MRWPLRRKPRTSARPAGDSQSFGVVDALTRPVNPNPAWRHSHPLATLPGDPRITHPVEFSQSVAGSHSLTARIGGAREADREPVGLVHLQARLASAPVTELADVIDLTRPEPELPLRFRPRRLPSVPAPAPMVDLVHAPPPPADDDGDDGFGFGWDGPGEEPPPPPAPEPAPEVTSPDRMRVFRPRRLGLGEPLPSGTRPGDEPERSRPDEPERSTDGDDDGGFNAALDAAIRDAEAARAFQEPVPHDLRSTLSTALGHDVGSKPVHRGPDVTQHARSLGARAFTREGEVFVSDDVGSLVHPEARATVAHELTHVAQQESLGPALPDEGTDAGRALERAARSVEDFVRGTPNAPRPTPELLHPDRVPRGPDVVAPDEYAQLVADELVRRGLAYRDSLGDLVVGSPTPASTVESGVQRQTATAQHSVLNPSSFAELRDNLITGIRGDVEHGILDQWSMSDEMRRQVETDEQTDVEERRMLRELNENVDRENEQRRAHHLPLLPAVTALTDQQRTTIRDHVAEHFRQQDEQHRRTQAQQAGTAHPTGGAPTTGGATTGTGTSTGTGTGTGTGTTQPSDEGRPATWRRFGEQIGIGLAGMAAGVWGIDLPAEHHDAAATPAAGAGTTPAAGGATTPTGTPAGTPATGAGTTAAGAATGTAAGAAAGTAAAHPGAHAGHFADLDDHDVEELVRRVYSRLRTSLRNELLTDRERAGMLADFR